MTSPGDDEQTQQNAKEEKPDVQQLTIVVKAQVRYPRSAVCVVTLLVGLTVLYAPVRWQCVDPPWHAVVNWLHCTLQSTNQQWST